jgi:SAM-dependent methyltransferase
MNCRNCQYDDLQSLIDLGSTPLADDFPKAQDALEVYYPLHAYICPICFLIQLDNPVIPSKLFNDDYGFFTGGSPAAVRHFQQYSLDVMERHPEAHSILEIASNDGTLLGFFKNAGKWVLGIEPTANTAKWAREHGIETQERFFSEAVGLEVANEVGQADIVIANNVLAHVPDPLDFLKGIRALLKPSGTAIIEVHHAANLILKNQFDNFYHEHYSYFLYDPLEELLERAQLLIYDVQTVDTQGGSIRIYASPEERWPSERLDALSSYELGCNLYETATYEGYGERIESLVRRLVAKVGNVVDDGKTVYAYGASAKGNTLLNYSGLGTHFIKYVVDMTPDKIGRFTPGTKIPIISPEQEAEIGRPDYYLLTVWNYLDAVLQRESEFREQGGKFIVPLPEPIIE